MRRYGNPVLKENLGGKFNLSNPKSDVDWMVWRSNQLPAPGQCVAPILPPKITTKMTFCSDTAIPARRRV